MNYITRLDELGIKLPACPQPVGSYRSVVFAGKIAFLSGQVAKTEDGTVIAGKVGQSLDLKKGQEAARVAALNIMSVIKNVIGFEQFDRFLRLVGYVQTANDFYNIAEVMNGASDLMVQVFGEKGIHARSAVGVASLPLNAAVEIEATVQIK